MSSLGWKGDCAQHRTARQTVGEAEPQRTGNRKNTKRWCKGVPGREHEWAEFRKHSWLRMDHCLRCGRERYTDYSRADLKNWKL